MKANNSGAEKCFLHDTEVNKRKFMGAVHSGDVKTAKQLIEEGININFILDNYSPLHAAIKQESMDMFELLLSQPNIDLDISVVRKKTPLLWSFRINSNRKELFILRLIRAGCDINIISNQYGKTPLHLSLQYPSITCEFLKQGADVNAQSPMHGTALHYAVRRGNLEYVCMLLYYNADVYIKWKGHTPFSLALCNKKFVCNKKFEIVEVLSYYYSFLYDDINYIIDNDEVCIAFLRYNAELFKAVWPRFDQKIILNRCPKFIENYLNRCKYSKSDWVECLYLILNSDIAFDLIEHTDNFFDKFLNSTNFLKSEDRIGLLYMVLGLGFEIEIKNFNLAVVVCGLNQDLEPFIYHTYNSITDGFKFICPQHAFVIGMQTDYSIKRISQLFHDASEEWIHQNISYCIWRDLGLSEETCIKPVAFFSFPADVKNDIINLYVYVDKRCQYGVYYQSDYITMLRERLQEIPEFPSLMELSRNRIHKYLVEKFRFKQPYQLQDCVKKLLIPNKIKDIILFKEPIYSIDCF